MMKRIIESRIVLMLKKADAGVLIKELCRQHGIASSNFHKSMESQAGLSIK